MTHKKSIRIVLFAALPCSRSTIRMVVPLACALLLGPNLQVGQAMQQLERAPPGVLNPSSDVTPAVAPVPPAESEQRQPGDNLPVTSKTILQIPLPQVFQRVVTHNEWISGPTDVPLGNIARLHVPVGYRVSGMTAARDWMKLWRGKPSDELAIVLADDQQTFGVVTIETISNIGNSEPADLDADSLLTSLQSRIDNSNRNKLRRGIGLAKTVRVDWTFPPVWTEASATLCYGVRRIQRKESTAEAHVVAIGRNDAIRLRLFACDATVSSTIPSPAPFASAIEFVDKYKRTNPVQQPGDVTKAETVAAVAPAATTLETDDAAKKNAATPADVSAQIERPTLSSLIEIPAELHQVSTTTKPWFFYWIPDVAWAFVPDWIARLGWFEWLLISTALTTGWGYLRMRLRKLLIDRANAHRLRGEKTHAQQKPATNSPPDLATVTWAPATGASATGSPESESSAADSTSIPAAGFNPAAADGTTPPPPPKIAPPGIAPTNIAPLKPTVMPPPLPASSTGGE